MVQAVQLANQRFRDCRYSHRGGEKREEKKHAAPKPLPLKYHDGNSEKGHKAGYKAQDFFRQDKQENEHSYRDCQNDREWRGNDFKYYPHERNPFHCLVLPIFYHPKRGTTMLSRLCESCPQVKTTGQLVPVFQLYCLYL
ncbi:hypothetical protein SDC9_192975 [bioreactor metagenome]|uniref:Uncharacterized protein n=1 Tax=bioreactor metagenome TaxID=1076179 RepID=A0A645I2E2_9ZZZZ